MTDLDFVEYIFQLRKYRITHPNGFHEDGWSPDEDESAKCCPMYSPRFLRDHPYVVMQHCRTRKHIEQNISEFPWTQLEKLTFMAEWTENTLKDPLDLLAWKYSRYCLLEMAATKKNSKRVCTRPADHAGRHGFSGTIYKGIGKPQPRSWWDKETLKHQRRKLTA